MIDPMTGREVEERIALSRFEWAVWRELCAHHNEWVTPHRIRSECGWNRRPSVQQINDALKVLVRVGKARHRRIKRGKRGRDQYTLIRGA